MTRTLVVGYGNIHRQDDGAGPAVVQALRARLGQLPLPPDEDGFDRLGQPVDSVTLHQLVPELVETLSDYDLVIFVDAHVGELPEALREERLAACFRAPLVSHQVHPCTLLALVHEMFGRDLGGVLLSLRGHCFDYGEGLSPDTIAVVPRAVERIVTLIEAGGATPLPCP